MKYFLHLIYSFEETILFCTIIYIPGAVHEQNRPDRDVFLQIDKDAMEIDNYNTNFQKKPDYSDTSETTFDFCR